MLSKKQIIYVVVSTCLALCAQPDVAQTSAFDEARALIEKVHEMASDKAEHAALLQQAAQKVDKLLSSSPAMSPQLVPMMANLGQFYQDEGNAEASVTWWQKVVAADPLDWRAWCKIIQCSQALGDMKQRDVARKQVYTLAKDGKVDQNVICRDQFRDHEHPVMVLEYWKNYLSLNSLTGNSADKNFNSFVVRSDGGKKTLYRYVLCELGVDTQLAREMKTIPANQHRFSIDRYDPSGSVGLIAMFDGAAPPEYEKVKATVVADLAQNFH